MTAATVTVWWLLVPEQPPNLPCFVLCSPDGPKTPFVGQMLAWDAMRVVCLLAGVAVVILVPRCVFACRTWGQRARFVTFGMFCLSMIATEYEHIGDYSSFRLAFNFIGVVAALAGTVAFLTKELPAQSTAARHGRSRHRLRRSRSHPAD